MGLLARIFGRKSLRDEIATRGGIQYVQIGSDGFIPSLQFASGLESIESDLTAAIFYFAAITANAEAASSLEPILRKRDGNEWFVLRDERRPRIFDSPCIGACERFTWQRLVQTLYMQLEVRGRCFARIVRTMGETWLQPLNPDYTTVERNAFGEITHYTHQSVRILPEDMLHIDLGSPDPLSDGLSPYTAARKAVTLDALASQRQAYGAQNVAQVGMVLRTRGTLSKEQREVFRAEINSAHAGAAKSGAPLVIGDNVEVIDAPKQAPENMLDLRKYNQTEICAVTGTPPPVIGIYDSATLANFKQCLKIWWAVRLEPRLRLVYEAFNRQVFKLADRQVWFDLSSSQLALPLVLERAEVAEKLVVGLGYPANAAARRVGLDLEYFPELDLPNVKFTIAGRTGGKDAET